VLLDAKAIVDLTNARGFGASMLIMERGDSAPRNHPNNKLGAAGDARAQVERIVGSGTGDDERGRRNG
jgi:hypothetical protein